MNRMREKGDNSVLSSQNNTGINCAKQKRNKNTTFKDRNQMTVETVRMIMEEEGRSARNLVSWSIPLDSYTSHKVKPKRNTTSSKRAKSYDSIRSKDGRSSSGERVVKKASTQQRPDRLRSNSGRRQVSIRARYWAYLFENLRRAVDEIYATCETDASVVECKEVLLVLNNYRHEFQALIDWINLQERLENTDDRPTSLAWEVRKSSPGRPRQKITPKGATQPKIATMPLQNINRCLNFNKSGDAALPTENDDASHYVRNIKGEDKQKLCDLPTGSTVTWADRVKGIPPYMKSPTQESKVAITSMNKAKEVNDMNDQLNGDDSGTWETVISRGKQTRNSKQQNQQNLVNKSLSSPSILQQQKATQKPKKVEEYAVKMTEKSTEVEDSASSYVNLVVDRIIGSAGMSPTTTKENGIVQNPPGLVEKFPVESEQSDVLNFGEKNDLQDLDEAEADFFKAVQEDNAENIDPEKKRKTVISPKQDVSPSSRIHLRDLQQEEVTLARALHAEHDVSIAAAEEQERMLRKEIKEVEEEKDDSPEMVETDSESARSSAGAKELPTIEKHQGPLDWNEFMSRFEVDQPPGSNWGDLVEEEELREPGRIAQMHEKLSSPSRKRTPAESKRKLEEKHRKAEERRIQMSQEKAQRIHELTVKVQDVVNWKNDLKRRNKDLLQSYHDEKLARAEEQRAIKLLDIVRKAQVEDTKVGEIAFINELQEQNKRHEVLKRIGEHEDRLSELEQERTKMQEVKYIKEESVKERRRALEKERQERIEELKIKRKEQNERIIQQKIEKEKEREKLAKDKARERVLRLSALNAAQQEAVTELQKKIQMKHDESERRHQEHLEQRKDKAQELRMGRFTSLSSSLNSGVGNNLYAVVGMQGKQGLADNIVPVLNVGEDNLNSNEEKATTVNNVGEICQASCTITTGSAVGSPRSNHEDKTPNEEELKAQIERKKAMRKRIKKLRTRMQTRGKEFLKKLENKPEVVLPAVHKTKIVRLIKDITRSVAAQQESSGPWPANRVSALDRALGEINRILEKHTSSLNDKTSFRIHGGFEMLEKVFLVALEGDSSKTDQHILPDKSICNAVTSFRLACERSIDNSTYALFSNRITTLVDLLLRQLTIIKTKNNNNNLPAKKAGADLFYDTVPPSLLHAMAVELDVIGSFPPSDFASSESSNVSKSYLRATVMTSSKDSDARKMLEGYVNRGLDVIGYAVASGILDELSHVLSSIRHEVAPGSNMASFIEYGLKFLEATICFVAMRNKLLPDNQTPSTASKTSQQSKKRREMSTTRFENDPTQLLPTLQHTELMGIVSVLYGLLLHGAPERPTSLRSLTDLTTLQSPHDVNKIPDHSLSVALAVMRVLNAVSEMDLALLQGSLGAEGVSLELRHICTYLLWYCVKEEHHTLLKEVIICVGHFTLDNKHNQNIVDTGAQPTVLQQLCLLPFSFFSSPSLVRILFPTLIACCYGNDDNLARLEQEASGSLLSGFIEANLEEREKAAKDKNKKEDTCFTSHRSLSNHISFTSDYLRGALSYFNEKHDQPITYGPSL